MDYRDLVSSLECETPKHRGDRIGELIAQGAVAIADLHHRTNEFEADIEDLMHELATIKAAETFDSYR